ncbi:hypothetical protein WR25_24857 [Diploscapter pachys]|uniref:Uncharacterized protein n=1 Tax=Diploscapter pachys TaxID=2018661 RepID=A0A2A2L4H8_9BILA|nr:hypothetical protein WR25_24857 [Diploscapter pachys]
MDEKWMETATNHRMSGWSRSSCIVKGAASGRQESRLCSQLRRRTRRRTRAASHQTYLQAEEHYSLEEAEDRKLTDLALRLMM